MEISKEDFNKQFQNVLDDLLTGMAENSEIDLKKFYGTACFLENIAFFSPVFYEILKKSKNIK